MKLLLIFPGSRYICSMLLKCSETSQHFLRCTEMDYLMICLHSKWQEFWDCLFISIQCMSDCVTISNREDLKLFQKYIVLCYCSLVAKSCLTPCNTMDCSPPGSSAMGFSRQYQSGLHFPSPGDLPDPGIKPTNLYLLHWQADSLLLSHQGSPMILLIFSQMLHFKLMKMVFLLLLLKAFFGAWKITLQM